MNSNDIIFQGPNAAGNKISNLYGLLNFLEYVSLLLFMIALVALFYYSSKNDIRVLNFSKYTLLLVFILNLVIMLFSS